MNYAYIIVTDEDVSAGCHINDVMNATSCFNSPACVSAGWHINDVMNSARIHLPSI